MPMTPHLERYFCKSLMTGLFVFVGSDSTRYRSCFDICVKQCLSTGVFKATSWNSWNGFANLLAVMERVERLTRHTQMLHCPSAPILMVTIAMQQVILHDKMGQNDKVCRFLRDFDCHNKASTAIYYFEMNYYQDVLTLDQPWNSASSVQRVPIQSMEQSEPTAFDEGPLISRNNAAREIITLDEEQGFVKVESPDGYRVAESREERRQEPIPTPVPMLVPGPGPGPVPTSMPALVRETHKQVFRAEVMMHLQPLLDRLKSESWSGVIQRDIMQALTDKNVKVLTMAAKHILSMWAAKSENTTLLSWLEQARDDVDTFQWTERYVESTPPAWLNCQSAHAVFHDLAVMIMGIPQSAIRGPLQAKMNTLRDIFDRQEKSHKEEMLNRVDGIYMEIAKLHDQMVEFRQMGQTKQMDAQAIELSDETDEDAEKPKKAKKNKGDKEKKEKRKMKEDRVAGRKRLHQEMEEGG
ncbi:hypothetical protein V8C37DRAFT_385796 [Trichoderma ceciliae]